MTLRGERALFPLSAVLIVYSYFMYGSLVLIGLLVIAIRIAEVLHARRKLARALTSLPWQEEELGHVQVYNTVSIPFITLLLGLPAAAQAIGMLHNCAYPKCFEAFQISNKSFPLVPKTDNH